MFITVYIKISSDCSTRFVFYIIAVTYTVELRFLEPNVVSLGLVFTVILPPIFRSSRFLEPIFVSRGGSRNRNPTVCSFEDCSARSACFISSCLKSSMCCSYMYPKLFRYKIPSPINFLFQFPTPSSRAPTISPPQMKLFLRSGLILPIPPI